MKRGREGGREEEREGRREGEREGEADLAKTSALSTHPMMLPR